MTLYDPRRPMKEHLWTVEGLWSPAACAEMIASAEARGFGEAPITTASGPQMRKDVRNNERVLFEDHALAQSLFEKVRSHVPAELPERHAPPDAPMWRAVGLNERFRVYRYHVGQQFKPHFDGCFIREDGVEESALTFMIYLDDDFVGGQTAFLDHGVSIAPKTGMALFFHHPILHEGCVIERGVKHVLRTDVMYRRG